MTLTEILTYSMISFSILIFLIWIISYLFIKINKKEDSSSKTVYNFPNYHITSRNNYRTFNQNNNHLMFNPQNRNFTNTQSNFSIPTYNKYFIYHNKPTE